MKIIETETDFVKLVTSGRVRNKYAKFFEALDQRGFLVLEGMTDGFYQTCRMHYPGDFASCTLPDGNRMIFLKSRVSQFLPVVE